MKLCDKLKPIRRVEFAIPVQVECATCGREVTTTGSHKVPSKTILKPTSLKQYEIQAEVEQQACHQKVTKPIESQESRPAHQLSLVEEALRKLNSQIGVILPHLEVLVSKMEKQQIELNKTRARREQAELEMITHSAREHLKRRWLV